MSIRFLISILFLLLVPGLAMAQQTIENPEAFYPPDTLQISHSDATVTPDSIAAEADSLRNAVSGSKESLSSGADSLTAPADELMGKLSQTENSLNQTVKEGEQKAQDVADRVNNAVAEKAEELETKAGNLQRKAGGVTENLPDDVNTELPSLPEEDLPEVEVPESGIGSPAGKMPAVPGQEMKESLPAMPDELSKAGELQQKIGAAGSEVQQLKEATDSLSVEKAAAYGEEKVKDTKYYKALEEKAGTDLADKEKLTEEGLKEEGKKHVEKEVKNYFAGHEDKIREAQSLMAKYKKKYHSLESIKDVPLNRNPLADTPVARRLVYGAYIQLQKEPWGADLNPVIGYQIFPRWEAGVGGVYRVLMDVPDTYKYAEDPQVYGGRLYTSYEIANILAVHAEYEYINALVVYPPSFSENNVPSRQWNSGLLTGIRKKINIGDKFQMRGVILYNFLHDYRSPYGSEFHVRLGFFYLNRR